jgi:archaetidylinositol phosphate synthase
MVTSSLNFCEPPNPFVLSEVRQTKAFQNATRVQESILAGSEKRVLRLLASRAPAGLRPDHLTAFGFLAQIMAGVSYAMAGSNCYWLLAAIGFLALNWLGDSLDGTLARFRQQQRPRYGFYVDHMVDSFGALALMSGLALSGFMHPQIAIGLLVAFLLLSIQSYLASYTLAEFRLSFWSCGPTEIRILLAIGNLALLRWPRVLKGRYLLFDVGGVIAIAGMLVILLIFTARNTCRLYREERLS